MIEYLTNKGNETIRDLIKNYDRLGLRASGGYEKGLRPEIVKIADGWQFIIWGLAYGEFMENGRGPSRSGTRRRGQPGELIKAIKKWVEDKGIDISPYAITAKIHRDGIKVPNRFNKGGVISGVINKKYLDGFYNEFGKIRIDNIYSEILKTWRQPTQV